MAEGYKKSNLINEQREGALQCLFKEFGRKIGNDYELPHFAKGRLRSWRYQEIIHS